MESGESLIGFPQYWLILKRRWFPASVVFGFALGLTVLSISVQKPIYQAEGKLVFKKTNTTSSLTGIGKEIGQLNSLVEQGNPLNAEMELIRSIPLAQKTIAQLDLKDQKGTPLKVKQFLKQLTVTTIRGADILSVSYKDKDSKKATEVVKTLIALYIENNQYTNRAEAVAAREFIEKELPTAEASVRKAEAALRQFKEQNQVVALQEEAKSAVEVMGSLEKQSAEAQSKLADAIAQVATLQNELQLNPQEALTATALSQSPGVQDALKELQLVERQLAVERIRFQEANPAIANLEKKEATLKILLQEQIQQVIGSQKQLPNGNLQIGEVKPKLIEEFVKLEAQQRGLANQVSALSNEQIAYKQRLSIMPKLEQEQRELESKLQAAQSTYGLLLQKFQEIRIAENQNTGNARLLHAVPVPEEPMASRKSLFLVTGILLGSLLAIATALFLEATDKSIRTVEEAQELFGFTLLGVIPFQKNSPKIILYDKDVKPLTTEMAVKNSHHLPISTAYSMLQANLEFLCTEQQHKAIVVSSSVPIEGKSTVCANLAIAMAQQGRKVLLIDANMHHPVQHHIWKLPNQVGLGHVILEQATLQTALTEVITNLEVLTSGIIHPNPVNLLYSQQVASLLENLAANYDLVIIDTPSLKVAADALILGKMVGAVLLVVRPGVVDADSIAAAKEFLQKSGQNVLGQVVNGVISRNAFPSFPLEICDQFLVNSPLGINSNTKPRAKP